MMQFSPERAIAASASYADFYHNTGWQDLSVVARGGRLSVYGGGRLWHSEVWRGAPAAGALRFVLGGGDNLALDDCLFYPLEPSAMEPGRFAFDLLDALAARDTALGPPPNWGENYLEDFNSAIRTEAYWAGEPGGPGAYVEDPAVEGVRRRYFYRLEADDAPRFRRWRDDAEPFSIGEAGGATDYMVKVDVKFPEGARGVAWLGARAWLSVADMGLHYYRLSLEQAPDGARTVTARVDGGDEPVILWQGPEPDAPDADGWATLTIVVRGERIAFLVNGRMVYVGEAEPRAGSVVIGVEPDTVALFDELAIRGFSDLGLYMR
ncbi:MAG: hypothetical protein M5R40_26355 [Anaerolineae bacterium]|nr:hypothetical protein [Anaerolineae bacterium]